MPQSFRERVDVTSIIRSIPYPLGLRELLQNSDDAGATEQVNKLPESQCDSRTI